MSVNDEIRMTNGGTQGHAWDVFRFVIHHSDFVIQDWNV
jgi:hypothetical protein